jgi:hypothetical protein
MREKELPVATVFQHGRERTASSIHFPTWERRSFVQPFSKMGENELNLPTIS